MRFGVEMAKELYYRAKYRTSRNIVTYTIEDLTAQFHATTFTEFRRFQSLMGEEDVLRDLIGSLEPEDVFFDVGANVGTYACFAAAKLNGGRVVAFEPEPRNANRLQENAALNRIDIDLYRIALSDSGEPAYLTVADPTQGAGKHALARNRSDHTIEITQERGDVLVDRKDIPEPTVIKIDVEGAEGKVLKGLTNTISRKSCRLVYCEIHPEPLVSFGYRPEQIHKQLEENGFAIQIVRRFGDKYFIKAKKG